MLIEPNTSFLVDYKINNPSDAATYFVQAKIYNSVTGALIATLNLTDNGSKYYSKLWTTPVDNSGVGLQIKILTTVYEDAGHTVESAIYGTTLQNYIVRHLATQQFAGGPGGSNRPIQTDQTDYKAIERIVKKLLAELPKPESHMAALQELRDLIADLDAAHGENLVNVQSWLADRLEEVASRLSDNFDTGLSMALPILQEGLKAHEKNSLERHKGIRDSIDGIVNDTSAAEKGDEVLGALKGLDETLRDSHAALIEGIKKPISVKLRMAGEEEDGSREGVKNSMKQSEAQIAAKKKKEEDDNTNMTIQKLIELSNAQQQ